MNKTLIVLKKDRILLLNGTLVLNLSSIDIAKYDPHNILEDLLVWSFYY